MKVADDDLSLLSKSELSFEQAALAQRLEWQSEQ